MASEIRTLKDKDIQVLPRTKADAVSTTDGSTVQEKINNIPTDLADLNQDSTHRLVTDTEKLTWNIKPDFSDIPTQLSQLNDDSTHRLVTDTEKNTWNNKSDFSGSYTDLTNKPTIPTQLSQLSQDSTHRVVTDTEKSTWNNKSDFSGSYTDLTNKPSIPTISTSVASTSTTTAASSSAVKSAYDLASDAMPKSGGTFTGSIYAGSSNQSYNTSLLRNSKLVSSETTPTYNGEIYWVYG